VSVIVCVHRDVQKLTRLLKHLLAQSYPTYEIIIVNDGPQKDISDFLHGQTDARLKVLDFDSDTKDMPGKKAPLTAGIECAHNEWLLLTDADCVPGPQWISEMMRHASPDVEIVLGVAPLYRKPSFLNLLQRFDNMITAIQYLGAAIRGKAYMGVGRNLLYRKELHQTAGGFTAHAHMVGGDDDLFVQAASNASNTVTCINPSAFVYSEAPASGKDWLRQKRRHLSAGKIYSRSAKVQTTLFAVSWFIAWVCLPFVFLQGTYWLTTGVLFCSILWFLFARVARRLEYQELTPWFPFLVISYCIELCTFAILLILPAPKTWMTS